MSTICNIYRLTMDRNSINVIIFDDDEPSMKEHRDSRTIGSTKPASSSNNHHIEIIEQEIQYLTDRIKGLEQQAESLSQLRIENPSQCRSSSTSIETGGGHSAEVLMAIQKKIQIVVRETKKLVDRLGDTFQKKLQVHASKKMEENGLGNIKEQYAASLKKIEQNYKTQIQQLQHDHKEVESKMLVKVNAVEGKLVGRMRELEVKEKEYVDWIHHLERQLQEKQDVQDRQEKELKQERQQREKLGRQRRQDRQERVDKPERQERQDKSKSRRMIDVTHVKKQQSQNSSVLTGDVNYESVSTQKMGSQANDSKIQRRHRIFDPVGNKSISVSPNSKVVSPLNPLSSQSYPSNVVSSKVINPLTKSKQPDRHPERHFDNPVQADKPALVIEKTTEPMKNNFTGGSGGREHSPWRAMDSIEKSQDEATKRNIIKDVNEDEFYKDVPRASQGWQRFQDYKENDDENSSDSEQQVIFYRNEDRKQSNWPSDKDSKWTSVQRDSQNMPNKRQSTYDPGTEQRVFSPFDLN